MKYLLFGATGQLGQSFVRHWHGKDDFIALDRQQADFLCPQDLSKHIFDVSPDVIINAAAYTAVDKAEAEPETALQINAKSVGEIARAAHEVGAKLIHFSTDYVFDGCAPDPYNETHKASPVNAYGRSKYAGEEEIIAATDNYWIFRTSWLVSPYRDNFVKTIIRLAQRRETLLVVNDQFGIPTATTFLVEYVEMALAKTDALSSGIYHLTPKGKLSWYELACYIIAVAADLGAASETPFAQIEPVSSAQYGAIAQRPQNSLLACDKFQSALNIDLPDWQNYVDDIVKHILGGKEYG